MSRDPTVRRLAVQTEDHPMAYNAFEGRIPAREYGAGDVLLWDRGTYETVPPGQQRAMLDKGHMHVRLFGTKLVGQWHFIRTQGRGGDDGAGGSGKAQWLFFKAKDAQANPAYDVVAERPESVVSGRSATRGPLRVGASERGKSAKALLDGAGEPMLATAAKSIAQPEQFQFEAKYDGYRLLAGKAGAEVRLRTRRSHDWTDRFPPIAEWVARNNASETAVLAAPMSENETNRRPKSLASGARASVPRSTRPPPRANRTAIRAAPRLLRAEHRHLRRAQKRTRVRAVHRSQRHPDRRGFLLRGPARQRPAVISAAISQPIPTDIETHAGNQQ